VALLASAGGRFEPAAGKGYEVLAQLAQFEPRFQRIRETGCKGIIELRMA
jgi:hypothetical protein